MNFNKKRYTKPLINKAKEKENLNRPAPNNLNELTPGSPINSKMLKFNYTIDEADIYRAIKNGDKDFFFLSRMQSKTILEFRYIKGNCFHLAVKFMQPEICQILVILFAFGIFEHFIADIHIYNAQ